MSVPQLKAEMTTVLHQIVVAIPVRPHPIPVAIVVANRNSPNNAINADYNKRRFALLFCPVMAGVSPSDTS